MVPGIKETASAHEDAKSTAQRAAGQSVKQNWDCSQIENEEEEEEEDWQKENQIAVQWAEDEKWKVSNDETLKADVMQKVLELVVQERMSQCEKARGTKEKKKLKDGLLER